MSFDQHIPFPVYEQVFAIDAHLDTNYLIKFMINVFGGGPDKVQTQGRDTVKVFLLSNTHDYNFPNKAFYGIVDAKALYQMAQERYLCDEYSKEAVEARQAKSFGYDGSAYANVTVYETDKTELKSILVGEGFFYDDNGIKSKSSHYDKDLRYVKCIFVTKDNQCYSAGLNIGGIMNTFKTIFLYRPDLAKAWSGNQEYDEEKESEESEETSEL